MTVTPRDASDLVALCELVRSEPGAKQRDRYRAVLLAAVGDRDGVELEGDEIAVRLGRSARFVDQWLARYRRDGLGGLEPRKAKGRPPKLDAARQQAFKDRVLAGPVDADGGVCTLRGEDARRILAGEFEAEMTLDGVYKLMRRLNLSCLKPRPRHRKNDPAKAADWLGRAPFLPRK
jgi:transposase